MKTKKNIQIPKKIMELINADGSIIDKDWVDTDSEIKVNNLHDMGNDNERELPQTTDDFVKQTSQGGNRFFYYGYGSSNPNNIVRETVSSILEDMLGDKYDNDIQQISKNTEIPATNELSKSYGETQIESELLKLSSLLNQKSSDTNGSDISAIVLSEILKSIKRLDPNHKKTLIRMIKQK